MVRKYLKQQGDLQGNLRTGSIRGSARRCITGLSSPPHRFCSPLLLLLAAWALARVFMKLLMISVCLHSLARPLRPGRLCFLLPTSLVSHLEFSKQPLWLEWLTLASWATHVTGLWSSCGCAVLRSGPHGRPVRLVASRKGCMDHSMDARLALHKLHGILCSFLSFTDIINGAQEKCVLPPMDGYPHCEGKIKVRPKCHIFICIILILH